MGTWKEAFTDGEVRYFTGTPCKAGHIAERFTNNRNCVECAAISASRSFAKKYHSDPEFANQRNAAASEWKKVNRSQVSKSAKEWRDRNPGKSASYCKRWRSDNREQFREIQTRWRQNNRQKARDAVKRWENKNPERAALVKRASKTNRRAREIANGGRCSADDITELFKKQKSKCAACLKKFKTLEVDHIIAIANGGSSDPSNLQLLCKPCNRSKSDKDAIEWAQKHGRLL